MSCAPHPARRKGEVHCRGTGRDWGPNSHILPGRRVNEPNHQAWKYLVETDADDDEPSQAAIDAVFSDYIDEASVAVTRTFEDSFRMLKSVMEMMAFIEGLRVMHHDGPIASKTDKRLDRLSNDSAAAIPGDPIQKLVTGSGKPDLTEIAARRAPRCLAKHRDES